MCTYMYVALLASNMEIESIHFAVFNPMGEASTPTSPTFTPKEF